MTLSTEIIRIAFLALPGIIGRGTYVAFIGRQTRKDWEEFSQVIVFALASYAIYGFISSFLGEPVSRITPGNVDAFSNHDMEIDWQEILCASAIGVLLGTAAAACYTYKLVSKFGRFIRVTRRYGDEDVWAFLHNTPSIDWVFVRDHRLGLVYYGWIRAFSDSGERRELLLEDVSVYDNASGDLLYESEAIYVSRDYYDMSIEVPCVPKDPQGRGTGDAEGRTNERKETH